MFKITTAVLLMAIATPLMAYIGPGAGISVLGSLLGILATILIAIGAIIFWPVRKFLKRRKAGASAVGAEASETVEADSSSSHQ